MSTSMRITLPGGGENKSPNSQLGSRLPVQDYDKARRSCIQRGKLFEDPYFPADESSLFFSQKLPFTPVWKRPKDIVKDPKMFAGGASRFDVSQGILGDCWLVAAIASLTQDRILLNKVIPEDQGFDRGYAGIFLFRFWHFGEWVDLVVDDQLPTHNGKLIFIHSTDDNEFWSALLEKAYAKLYGGYEALKGGKTSEAMVDFTGGVVEAFDLSKDNKDLIEKIEKNALRASLMSCSIKVEKREDMEAKLSSGLVKGHAYSVTGACTVTSKGKKVQLVRIRNPWGQKEWEGDWSDNSPLWKSISDHERKALLQDGGKEDGEFCMSFEDMKKHFTDLEICSISVDDLYEDENVKNWNIIVKNGSWLAKGNTAGGCRNFPTFTKNPQFIIELKEDSDGDGKCSCLIALMQKHRRKQRKMGVQDLCIGFSVYKAPPDGSNVLTKQYVDYNYSTGTSGSFTNAREVMMRFDLDPGTYIVLPCAFKPNEEGDFLLRIFTEKLATPKEGGAVVAAGGAAPQDNPRVAKVRAMFDRLAGSDGEIDAEELQDMLTASFSKDLSLSMFSLEACRSMIAMLDEDKNGTLNIEEFINLLETIAKWKKFFFKVDKDRSGAIEKEELKSAVNQMGLTLSSESFHILFNRFARRRRFLKLDDFVACLCRITIMDNIFKEKSRGGSVTLSKDEYFKLTLDA